MLDDADLADLARTCARRFPRPDDQRIIAKEAGISHEQTDVGDPELSWHALIQVAQRDGRLGRLAAVLARSAPGDESLIAVAKALGEVVRPPGKPVAATFALAGLGAALALGAVGAFVVFGGGPADAEKVGETPAKIEDAPVEPAPSAPEIGAPTTAPSAPPDPVASANSTGASVPVETQPPAHVPPITKVEPSHSARTAGSCAGSPGEVVGYWYAGTSSPGSMGETITLGRDARVRADYPRSANGHNAATQEVCVLTRGSQMKLLAAPIDASKGHWWVPVVGG